MHHVKVAFKHERWPKDSEGRTARSSLNDFLFEASYVDLEIAVKQRKGALSQLRSLLTSIGYTDLAAKLRYLKSDTVVDDYEPCSYSLEVTAISTTVP